MLFLENKNIEKQGNTIQKCLRSRCVYPLLMTNNKVNKTDKIIELSTLWLEPRGRANNSKRCVSLNYRNPALPMAILSLEKLS